MIFMFLVFLAAFALEVIGTWVSVIGLSSMFAASQVVIILAVCLDFAKVITVSYTYTYWKDIKLLAKTYYLIASTVLMFITSVGAFGYLSGEFQKAISDTNQQGVQLTLLIDEQSRNQKRKEAIDKQISQLPMSNVKGRTQLIKQFAPEVKLINNRLIEIDKELPALKIDSIKKNVEVGPIIYVAEAFNTTPELAVKWVILTIIFVFDPLAIALLLAGNSLVAIRKAEKHSKKISKSLARETDDFGLPEPSSYPPLPEVKQPDKPLSYPTVSVPLDMNTEPVLDSIIEPNIESDNSLSVVEPVIAEVIEQQIVEVPAPSEHELEREREIITLEQIMKPIHALKIHKSSLDDVDSKFGDLVEEEHPRPELRLLFNSYASNTAPPK